MVSDEQEFAARMTGETARHVVLRRLARATGLRRAVELAEQSDPDATAPLRTSELANHPDLTSPGGARPWLHKPAPRSPC